MGPAVVRRHLPLPVDDAFALVTDPQAHSRWIPLTVVHADGPLRAGGRIVGVSGPFAARGHGLVDRMVVERADPPGAPERVAVYRKVGPVLLGEARLEVRADDDGSVVTWVEDVHLARLPRGLTAPVLRPAFVVMTWWALARAAREARATDRR